MALPRLSPFDYLALHADDTARRLVDPRLRRFLEDDRQRGGGLIETARVFAAADLNLRVTAERLQVHPNTAQYRLRRIEERTGRNPRRIADLVDLLSAIASSTASERADAGLRAPAPVSVGARGRMSSPASTIALLDATVELAAGAYPPRRGRRGARRAARRACASAAGRWSTHPMARFVQAPRAARWRPGWRASSPIRCSPTTPPPT